MPTPLASSCLLEQGVALRCGLHGLAVSLSCFIIGKSRQSQALGQAGKHDFRLALGTWYGLGHLGLALSCLFL